MTYIDRWTPAEATPDGGWWAILDRCDDDAGPYPPVALFRSRKDANAYLAAKDADEEPLAYDATWTPALVTPDGGIVVGNDYGITTHEELRVAVAVREAAVADHLDPQPQPSHGDDMTPIPPPSPYIPAREEWLRDWSGPVEWCDGEGWRPDTFGLATGPGRLRLCGIDRFRLNPTRPEVRHLLADRLGLGMEYRSGPYAAGLCWWAGMTGRPVTGLGFWNSRPSCLEMSDSETILLARGCALVGAGGLLLPPLTTGTAPILWSTT